MNNHPFTLNQFFSYQGKESLSQDGLLGLDSSEQITALREHLLKKVKRLSWTGAFDEIINKIEDLLDVRLEDILMGAWNKYRDLLKYCDQEKYPPNETILVHLVEHPIISEHNPYLAVLVNDVEVARVEFTINLALYVKGAVLKIKGGKIMEILPGECQGKGTLACGKFVLLKQETKSFAMPYSIKLGDGVPILP